MSPSLRQPLAALALGVLVWSAIVYREHQAVSELLAGGHLAAIPETAERGHVDLRGWGAVSFTDSPQNVKLWAGRSPGLNAYTRSLEWPKPPYTGDVYELDHSDGTRTRTFVQSDVGSVKISRYLRRSTMDSFE